MIYKQFMVPRGDRILCNINEAGFLGLICTYTDPAQHLIVAGCDLDDPQIDRDLAQLCTVGDSLKI